MRARPSSKLRRSTFPAITPARRWRSGSESSHARQAAKAGHFPHSARACTCARSPSGSPAARSSNSSALPAHSAPSSRGMCAAVCSVEIDFCSGLVDLVVRVGHHGGSGHRLALAGERFAGRITVEVAEVRLSRATHGVTSLVLPSEAATPTPTLVQGRVSVTAKCRSRSFCSSCW